MLSGWRSDLRLYRRLVEMQVRAQVQYRAHLVIDIATYMALTTLEFTAILLYFGAFPTLLGWSVGDVALLAALTSLSFGLGEIVGAGFDHFSEIIRRGEFDRVLLRPAGAFMQIIGSDFRLRGVGRMIEGCLIFLLALHLLPVVHWTPASLLVMPLGVASGSVIFMALFLLGATMCFWTVETSELTNIVTDGGREMLSYPISIYHPALQGFFLFVVPLAFGSYVPACYILGRPLPFGLPAELVFAAPLLALAFALAAGIIWRFGVRHYQSTGS